MKFIIKLKPVHEASGFSQYSVHKETGMSLNTVKKYIGDKSPDDGVEVRYLPTEVIILCQHYGVDWRNPSIIQVIEDDAEEEIKTPLAATA